jgi:hypothetical protein
VRQVFFEMVDGADRYLHLYAISMAEAILQTLKMTQADELTQFHDADFCGRSEREESSSPLLLIEKRNSLVQRASHSSMLASMNEAESSECSFMETSI